MVVANTSAHNFIHRPFLRAWLRIVRIAAKLTLVIGVLQIDLARSSSRASRAALDAARDHPVRRNARLGLRMMILFTTAPIPRQYAPGLGWVPSSAPFRTLRTCARRHEPLRSPLQPALLQRRLSRRAPRLPGPALAHAVVTGRTRASRWPALLRWLGPRLDAPKRLVPTHRSCSAVWSPSIARAARACSRRGPVSHVAIVGGGLFPRTALILRDLLPSARIVIVDASADNLRCAGAWVSKDVELERRTSLECRRYPDAHDLADCSYDLLVVPLAFRGNREAIYQHPCTTTIVHDWLWRPRGRTAVVSTLLLKRVNVVIPER